MKRFQDILCVLEHGDQSKDALARAVTLAQNNQASLTAVAVAEIVTAGIGMPEGGPISADLQEALVSARAQELESLVDPYRKRIAIETRVLIGVPFLEIIREVLRSGHDLVIKAPENPDWLERLFGSDDMHLLRKCPCPVWLIKHQAPKSYRRILAAVDTDDDHPKEELKTRHALNEQILQMASSLALSDFAELHVVHVWRALGESAMQGAFLHASAKEIVAYVEQTRLKHEAGLQNVVREMVGTTGTDAVDFLKPQSHLLKGSARKEIPALAKRIGADLIVMGTVGRTGVPGFFMGNTAEAILDQIDCSVLAVKPPGFVTPVTLVD
ncbi:MAG: universal stress protein [Gammaproteobacteria bacterium]|nr:universal stress protein [Gammaproteobacteria bacterium]